MNGRTLLQLVRFDVAALVRSRSFLGTVALFGLIGWVSTERVLAFAQAARSPGNVWDVLFVAFSGPTNSGDLMQGMSWLLPYLVFMVITGNCVRGELNEMGSTRLLRAATRATWWWSKMATLPIVAGGYLLLGGITVTLVATARLPLAPGWSDLMRSGELWALPDPFTVGRFALTALGLAWSTFMGIAVFQNTLSLLWERPFYAFAIAAGLLVASWLFSGRDTDVVRWLPGAQSMLLHHDFLSPEKPGVSLAWSCSYNAMWNAVWAGLGERLLRGMDLFGPTGA